METKIINKPRGHNDSTAKSEIYPVVVSRLRKETNYGWEYRLTSSGGEDGGRLYLESVEAPSAQEAVEIAEDIAKHDRNRKTLLNKVLESGDRVYYYIFNLNESVWDECGLLTGGMEASLRRDVPYE